MNLLKDKMLKESIDIISNTNDLDNEDVVLILEKHVFPKAIRQNHSKDAVIKTTIDRDNFSLKAFKVFEVVPDDKEDFNIDCEIKESETTLDVGEHILEEIEDIDIDKRNCIVVAKQVLNAEINKLKKRKIREVALQFKNELANVVVKKYDLKRKVYFVEFNGEFTGIIPFSELTDPSEKLRVNERYFALMTDKEDIKFQEQVVFSRKGKDFLIALFEKEIPEVHDEVVEIKNIYLGKNKNIFVNVFSNDKNIDPIGIFVGVKGNRINNILKHINGGSIDVSLYSHEPSDIILSVFKDLEIDKISVLDKSIILFVSEDKFQTLSDKTKMRLKAANEFVSEKVIITTEALYESSNIEYTKYFKNELNLDEESASIIANSGVFRSIDDILDFYPEDIIDILNLDIEVEDVEVLLENIKNRIQERDDEIDKTDTNLKDIESLKKHHIKILLDKGIDNMSDLSDFSNDELCEEIPIDIDEANEVIMEARDIIYG